MSDVQSAPTAVAVLTHIVKSIVDDPDAVGLTIEELLDSSAAALW